MELENLQAKKFRKRLMGLDPGDVEAFLSDVNEELHRLTEKNENLKEDVQTLESEIKEHRDREKTIQAVLVSAQENAEQIRANAEREAKLVISRPKLKPKRSSMTPAIALSEWSRKCRR